MKILVDSNILVRVANVADPQHWLAKDAIAKLLNKKEELCVVPQNFYEFWVVATRPTSVNGLGYTSAQAENELAIFKQEYVLLDEQPGCFAEWEKLVTHHAIIGKNAHDARLVAAMIVHGVTHLL